MACKIFIFALAVSSMALGADTIDRQEGASRVVVKHREHNGVGYDTGYSTLQLFLAPQWKNHILPFLDLRGHAFNDGKFATNAGLGMRYNHNAFTFGWNFYYDFRDAKHVHPHQIGGGLEFLWEYLDLRFNGYGPIADTTNATAFKFDGFTGNSAEFKRRLTGALPVVDGEVGIPLGKRCGAWNWYLGLGSYYLFEKTVKNMDIGDAWGGKGRLECDIINRFNMRTDVTYDRINKWTIQGTAALRLPIGKHRKNPPCLARNQLPERAEIIPVQTKTDRRSVGGFIFVDNTSNSLGTFESPYPTLALAEANSVDGSIIYILPGNGTTDGMNMGITLKDNQRLHGSGSSVDLGNGFIIPARTPNQRPMLTNEIGGDTVTLAQNNIITGLHFFNSDGSGIASASLTGSATIIDNFFDQNVDDGVAIDSLNGGRLIAIGNTFDGNDRGIYVDTSSGTISLFMINNGFTDQTRQDIHIMDSQAIINLLCNANTSFNAGNAHLQVDVLNTLYCFVENISAMSPGLDTVQLAAFADNSTINGVIRGCHAQNSTGKHGLEVFGTYTNSRVLVENNQCTGNDLSGISIGSIDTIDLVATLRGNTTLNNSIGISLTPNGFVCATVMDNVSQNNTSDDFQANGSQVNADLNLVSPDGTQQGFEDQNTFVTTEYLGNFNFVTSCN